MARAAHWAFGCERLHCANPHGRHQTRRREPERHHSPATRAPDSKGGRMRRARRWFRRIAAVLATVAIGVMLGYLVPTVIADYTPKPQVQAAVAAESPLARAFIRAYVAADQPALTE